MNLLPAEVSGTSARVAGQEIALAQQYGALTGKVELGIRPEFLRLSATEGLPATVTRIEDVGRHRIVRATVGGTPISIIADEDARLGPDMTRVTFDPRHANIYADDWLVEGAA